MPSMAAGIAVKHETPWVKSHGKLTFNPYPFHGLILEQSVGSSDLPDRVMLLLPKSGESGSCQVLMGQPKGLDLLTAERIKERPVLHFYGPQVVYLV